MVAPEFVQIGNQGGDFPYIPLCFSPCDHAGFQPQGIKKATEVAFIYAQRNRKAIIRDPVLAGRRVPEQVAQAPASVVAHRRAAELQAPA